MFVHEVNLYSVHIAVLNKYRRVTFFNESQTRHAVCTHNVLLPSSIISQNSL